MTDHVPKTDEELVRRAEQAHRILRDELYCEAWATLENGLMTQWEATKPMQTQEREAIWHAMKAIKAHRQRLESFMQTGKQAEVRINQRKQQRVGTRPIR